MISSVQYQLHTQPYAGAGGSKESIRKKVPSGRKGEHQKRVCRVTSVQTLGSLSPWPPAFGGPQKSDTLKLYVSQDYFDDLRVIPGFDGFKAHKLTA